MTDPLPGPPGGAAEERGGAPPRSASPIADSLIEIATLLARWMGLQVERVSLSARERLEFALLIATLAALGLTLLIAGVLFINAFIILLISKFFGWLWTCLILGIFNLAAGSALIAFARHRLRRDDS